MKIKTVYSRAYRKHRFEKFLKKTFKVKRVAPNSIEFDWGYVCPTFGFEFIISRGGYFDQHYQLSICLIWGKLSCRLPFKTKISESCDTPRYGFQHYEDLFWIHLGGKMNDHNQCDSRRITWYLPWIHYIYEWTKYQMPNGEWIEGDWKTKDKAYQETHNYTYILNNGTVQNRKATCCIETMQWHRKWFPWIKKTRKTIYVNFDEEVGERAGSWKGGAVGCSYEMLPNETIEQTLRRMEKERRFN
jgi:hypothetical protein